MKGIKFGALVILGVSLFVAPVAYASLEAGSQLTQEINEGIISTSIRDSAGNIVAAPSFNMGSVSASTSMQTATGIYGSDSQRITVDNPGGSSNGSWTLAINATNPGTAVWTSGGDSYPYNGSTPADGQLTLDPSAGALAATVGGPAGISQGPEATFSGTQSITLMTASDAAAEIWNGYLIGVGVSQTIPASQALGTYSLDLTQTVTAG